MRDEINLRKAFALAPDYTSRTQKKVTHAFSIWLVDDILTTGSTMHFATKASLKLGLDVNVFR